MTPAQSKRSRRRAFTLVELLVVIGIIALLISILLPALSKARGAGQTTACLANLRSIGQAFQIYASDNHGYIVPAGWRNGASGAYGTNEMWFNILVNDNYVQEEDGTGKTPRYKTVLYCPGGVEDNSAGIASLPNSSPSSRVDNDGSCGMRSKSVSTGISTDCWYGINASTGNNDLASVPMHRVPADNDATTDMRAMAKYSSIPKSSETVMIFDGLFMNHMGVNANRVTARHENHTKTNLLFFDGHAKTYTTKELPGGANVAQVSDFAVGNLNSKYPAPAPRWRMDQD